VKPSADDESEDVRTATSWDISAEKNLPGPTSATRQFPVLDEDLARRLFNLHLMLTIHLISELSVDRNDQHGVADGFTEKDAQALHLAQRLMEAEGMIKMREQGVVAEGAP
jgi:hypothetical protein